MGLKLTISKFTILKELRKINDKFSPCLIGNLDYRLSKLINLVKNENPSYKDIDFLKTEIDTIETWYSFYNKEIEIDTIFLSKSLPEIIEEFGYIVWRIEEDIFKHLKQSQNQNSISLNNFKKSEEYLNFKQEYTPIPNDYKNLLQMVSEKLRKDIKRVPNLPLLPEF